MIRKYFDFLFSRKTIAAKMASKGEVTLEMVVTRADGKRETYIKDSKGQRRIS